MTTGVLLMAYGSPRTLEEVEPYYTDIRGGRAPDPERLEELKDRYRAIGGFPLTEITMHQAKATQYRLNTDGGDFKTYVGMKHWHPFIADAVRQIDSDGVGKVIGLALAPHYSKMSIGGYQDRVESARRDLGSRFEFEMVGHWYDEPAFVELAASNLQEALKGWDSGDGATRVFFTAHSLPERILAGGDPYRDQLHHSSQMIADAAGTSDYEFAFQSASDTGEPWLGPDIIDRLDAFKNEGGQRAVVAPIGFVADHLEVLYDIDIECVRKAGELGLELRRITSPNDDPRFIAALARIIRKRLL